VLQNEQAIQQPKRQRRDDEQIHRRNSGSVIMEKSLPSLGRRSPMLGHVLGNCRLPNIDAELEQFPMDARGGGIFGNDNPLRSVRRQFDRLDN
jgi:hypothetical protein